MKATLLRARIKSPLPFSVPAQVFIGSFSPEGGALPPIFEPQIDPTLANPDVVTLFGSVDAPYTILRFARRHGTCAGGPRGGDRCSSNEDCPGGACPTSCVDAPQVAFSSNAQCVSGPCGQVFNGDIGFARQFARLRSISRGGRRSVGAVPATNTQTPVPASLSAPTNPAPGSGPGTTVPISHHHLYLCGQILFTPLSGVA